MLQSEFCLCHSVLKVSKWKKNSCHLKLHSEYTLKTAKINRELEHRVSKTWFFYFPLVISDFGIYGNMTLLGISREAKNIRFCRTVLTLMAVESWRINILNGNLILGTLISLRFQLFYFIRFFFWSFRDFQFFSVKLNFLDYFMLLAEKIVLLIKKKVFIIFLIFFSIWRGLWHIVYLISNKNDTWKKKVLWTINPCI